MEYYFPLMKHLFIIHLVCLQVISAESGMRPRAEWRGGGGVIWTINTHQPRVMSRRWRRVSVLPADRREYSFAAGPIDKIDHDYLHQGFGGFSRRKASNRDHYGRFNSDTHGCNDIQTRSCSAHLRCTGCLGLYTCNLSLGKCQLKGLSQRTGKFLQALRNI